MNCMNESASSNADRVCLQQGDRVKRFSTLAQSSHRPCGTALPSCRDSCMLTTNQGSMLRCLQSRRGSAGFDLAFGLPRWVPGMAWAPETKLQTRPNRDMGQPMREYRVLASTALLRRYGSSLGCCSGPRGHGRHDTAVAGLRTSASQPQSRERSVPTFCIDICDLSVAVRV